MLSSSRLLPLLGMGLSLVLAGCGCPPLRSDFSSPEATLATWQAQLCHDRPEGEYRCLSAGMQAAMYGFPSYHAARQQLLRDDPVLAYLLGRIDLPARIVAREVSPDGRHVQLQFEEGGRRVTIAFVVETAVRVVLADGSELPGRIDGPLDSALVLQNGGQWIVLGAPRLSAAQSAALQRIELVQQWKIDALQGLEAVRPGASE